MSDWINKLKRWTRLTVSWSLSKVLQCFWLTIKQLHVWRMVFYLSLPFVTMSTGELCIMHISRYLLLQIVRVTTQACSLHCFISTTWTNNPSKALLYLILLRNVKSNLIDLIEIWYYQITIKFWLDRVYIKTLLNAWFNRVLIHV